MARRALPAWFIRTWGRGLTTTRIPTLRELFVPDGSPGTPEPRSHGGPPAVPHSISALFGPFEWQGVCDRVADLLEINVADILLGGWQKSVEIRKHLLASRSDPGRVILAYLGAHTIASEHRPSIEIRHEGNQFGEVTFPVSVEFQIEAVQLALRGGRVIEVRPGEVRMKGTVKVEGSVLLERSLAPVPLPGKIVMSAPSTGARDEPLRV